VTTEQLDPFPPEERIHMSALEVLDRFCGSFLEESLDKGAAFVTRKLLLMLKTNERQRRECKCNPSSPNAAQLGLQATHFATLRERLNPAVGPLALYPFKGSTCNANPTI
jgi:hypothetical protein